MGATNTVLIDGDATPDPIVADQPCRIVRIQEQNEPSTKYDVYEPLATSTPCRVNEGEPFEFDAGEGCLWQRNQTVGYAKTVVAGPVTFNKTHRATPTR